MAALFFLYFSQSHRHKTRRLLHGTVDSACLAEWPERRRSDCHSRLWLPDFNGGEVIVELNRRSAFGIGEVAVFQFHDALEHLRDPVHTMKELHRCLDPQGCLLSQASRTDGRCAFQDLTYVSFWNSNSFRNCGRAHQNRFIDCPVRFQANLLKNFFPSEWHFEHQFVYVKADLLKVAGRVPGSVAI